MMRTIGFVCLAAGVEHKFMQPSAAEQADKVLRDAGHEQQSFAAFMDEVQSSVSGMSGELKESQSRVSELVAEKEKAAAELKHAKEAFQKQIKAVEVKLVDKVKAVEGENAKLRKELAQAEVNVQLHSTSEAELKGRLEEMGRVFTSQENAVKSILTESSTMQKALHKQDAHKEAKEAVEAQEELHLEDEKEAKVEEPEAEVPEPAAEPAAAVEVEPAAEPQSTPKAAERPEPVADEPKEEGLDSLSSEVDTLASEADAKEPEPVKAKAEKAEPKPEPVKAKAPAKVEAKADPAEVEAASSADLLDSAGDELSSLLKQ